VPSSSVLSFDYDDDDDLAAISSSSPPRLYSSFLARDLTIRQAKKSRTDRISPSVVISSINTVVPFSSFHFVFFLFFPEKNTRNGIQGDGFYFLVKHGMVSGRGDGNNKQRHAISFVHRERAMKREQMRLTLILLDCVFCVALSSGIGIIICWKKRDLNFFRWMSTLMNRHLVTASRRVSR